MFGLFTRHKAERSHGADDAESNDGNIRPPSINVSDASHAARSAVLPGASGAQQPRPPRASIQSENGRHLSTLGGLPSSGSGINFAGSGRPRPGSLIVPSGDSSVPMLNVLRVFAAPDLGASTTYKTVLLNEATTASEIVKQAVQRFGSRRRSSQSNGSAGDVQPGDHQSDYALLVRVADGQERILGPNELPLKVYEHITEREADALMPSVRRSSVGSFSSITSNLSLKSAITKLNHDFSDDHAVKFFLTRQSRSRPISNDFGSSAGEDPASARPADSDVVTRFGARVLIFPDELPRSLAFDPSSSAIVRRSVLSGLSRHNSAGSMSQTIAESNPAYRETVLAVPRSSTVAEVIEQALEKFGIPQGVAEGGDEEDTHRNGWGPEDEEVTIPYGLTIDVDRVERHLRPSSAVYDAFPIPPTLRTVPREAGGISDRRSLDSTTILSLMAGMPSAGPVFVLRQQQHLQLKLSAPISRTARAWSPTERALASKRDAQRKSQLDAVHTSPYPIADLGSMQDIGNSAQGDLNSPLSPFSPPYQPDPPTPTDNTFNTKEEQTRRHEMIAAQRSKARALALEAARGDKDADRGSLDLTSPPSRQISIDPEDDDPDAIDAILNHVMQGGDEDTSEVSRPVSLDETAFPSIAAVTTQGRDSSSDPHAPLLRSVEPLQLRRPSPPVVDGVDQKELLSNPNAREQPDRSTSTSGLDVPGAYFSPTPSPGPAGSRPPTETGTGAATTTAAPAGARAGPASTPPSSGAQNTQNATRSIPNPSARTTTTSARHRSTPSAGSGSGGSHSVTSPSFASPTQSSTPSPISSRVTPSMGAGGPRTPSSRIGYVAPPVKADGQLGPLSLDHLYAVMDAAARPSSSNRGSTPLQDARSASRNGRRASRSTDVNEDSSALGWSPALSDGLWPDAQSVKAKQALQFGMGKAGQDAILAHFFAPSLNSAVSQSSAGSARSVSTHLLQLEKQLSEVDQALDQLLSDALRLP